MVDVMSSRPILGLCLLITLAVPSLAIDGTFQGRVVNPPVAQPNLQGWIYVQGGNHVIRRVEVQHAEIVYAQDLAVSRRHKCSLECLTVGQEIRVTAEQDRSGEWRAKRVEILKLTTNRI
jgi:hypothetical protein